MARRADIVATAEAYMGALSYRYDAANPDRYTNPEAGFDCSGFVSFVLTQAGIALPDYIGLDGERRTIRHASEFWDHFGVAVHPDLRQAGDLAFFSRNGSFPTHIGIVVSTNAFIHAPGRDGTAVTIEPLVTTPITHDESSPYRQLYSQNPIGFKAATEVLDEPTYRYHQQTLEA